jgi:hypothetical protein
MAERGGQPGNKNATKNRPITDAIRRVLLANDGEKLRKLAEAMVERAIEASDTAAKEVTERVDGKVLQEVEHSGDLHLTLAPADADA